MKGLSGLFVLSTIAFMFYWLSTTVIAYPNIKQGINETSCLKYKLDRHCLDK